MEKIIEIKEDVRIIQEGHDVILERGDKIKVKVAENRFRKFDRVYNRDLTNEISNMFDELDYNTAMGTLISAITNGVGGSMGYEESFQAFSDLRKSLEGFI